MVLIKSKPSTKFKTRRTIAVFSGIFTLFYVFTSSYLTTHLYSFLKLNGILTNHHIANESTFVDGTETSRELQSSGETTFNDGKTRRKVTDTGIEVSDPKLYAANTLVKHGDSSTATVIALATGYGLGTYQQFVGSLRKSGFKGHIILGVHPDIDNNSLEYMKFRNVTIKKLQWTKCTYTKSPSETEDIFKKTKCAHPYPDIKIRWSRFPLARDWIEECTSCTGPILLMDARDSIFQLDPFGPGSPKVIGLQVFQEHVNMTTNNWLTEWPIRTCKNVTYSEPMLCSGTTIGTRAAMLKYLEVMYAEMKVWIEDPKCRFDINGDDQSIHNYLYYSGQLPFAKSIPNRHGGIVNTIGHHAAQIAKRHKAKLLKDKGLQPHEAMRIPYEGANLPRSWIGPQYELTNEDGKFVEFDGSISRVIHQWDRFEDMYTDWLVMQPWATDRNEFEEYRRIGIITSTAKQLL